ncbi:MAG: hypothetical protein LBM73_00295 [Candidatus Nomurabacteria bacterium]|jgi:hypothetical protein|nr:hypothetical protein [Candidatus Nomurabacteria bacterium]
MKLFEIGRPLLGYEAAATRAGLAAFMAKRGCQACAANNDCPVLATVVPIIIDEAGELYVLASNVRKCKSLGREVARGYKKTCKDLRAQANSIDSHQTGKIVVDVRPE